MTDEIKTPITQPGYELLYKLGLLDLGTDIPETDDEYWMETGIRWKGPVSTLQPHLILSFSKPTYKNHTFHEMPVYTYKFEAPTWYVWWQRNGADRPMAHRETIIYIIGNYADFEHAVTLLKIEL